MMKAKLIGIALLLGLLMGLAGTDDASADDLPLPPTPGVVRGTGTHFEITDSSYLNVTLDSSKSIHVVLTSVPSVVNISLAAAAGDTSTDLTLSGLVAGDTYYLQLSGGVDPIEFVAESGQYSWIQDMSGPRNIGILTALGTLNLDGTPSGCPAPHSWNVGSSTCTLGANLAGPVFIEGNGITLDGNGFTITGGTWGVNVSPVAPATSITGVTVTDVVDSGAAIGVLVTGPSGVTISVTCPPKPIQL